MSVYILNGRRYNTETSTCLADNEFADGTNRISRGTCTYLYRTPNGAYWVEHLTQWQGTRNSIEVLTSEYEATVVYEGMRNRNVEWDDAFPNIPLKEA